MRMGKKKQVQQPISQPAIETPDIILHEPSDALPEDGIQIMGIPCKYARFKEPVQVKKDVTPVSEFSTDKHAVESILYGDHTVIVKTRGETLLIPHANVSFARAA